jgi:hypothetical protein
MSNQRKAEFVISIFRIQSFWGGVIPDFASITKYSSHVCPGSFIPLTQT